MLRTILRCSLSSRTSLRTMSSESDVLFNLVNRKGVVTMNRPKALNALSLSMIRTIEPVVRKWHNEDLTDMVILKACEGSRAFCAGGDVKAIAALKGDNDKFFREEYVLDHLLANMNAHLVSLIDGIVMGGGCGISFHCKFKVATEKTLFAMPETAIGLFPDVGACHFLSRMNHNLGVFFGLTGYRIKGEDLLHAGLVSHFVPSDKIKELESELMKIGRVSADQIDSLIKKYQPSKFGKFSLEGNLPEIEECFGGTTVEKIVNCLEKKGSDFSKKQLDTLGKMAPLSLKVTLKAIQAAKTMSLAEVLKMDMRLAARFMRDSDFYEGVEAALVRKTNDPKWSPATLKETTEVVVQEYFNMLPADQELVLDM